VITSWHKYSTMTSHFIQNQFNIIGLFH